ncbi:MAG TPA: PEGA domain-containing protein [Blastocatellia bacterium]|nr:PEGA domain-containing protein [Blastocatellia bacterium]
MHKTARVATMAFILLTALVLISCAGPQTETGNRNTPAAGNENAPPVPATGTTPARSEATDRGSIRVESTPAGAEVLLKNESAGGASPPESRGTTPMTITDLAPGAYTVHLEKPGYKFFQKSVDLKPGATATVKATLKK